MDFNIRAISLAETSVDRNARISVDDCLKKEFEFKRGISIRITLPDNGNAFRKLSSPEQLLMALENWARFYQYPANLDRPQEDKLIHVLATTDVQPDSDGEIVFYRLDLKQLHRVKPGPRPAVEIIGGAVMSYDECTAWLVQLAEKLSKVHPSKRTILTRPPFLTLRKRRLYWVGPEFIDGTLMPKRLAAVGSVSGWEIVHLGAKRFHHVKAELAKGDHIDAVFICSKYAPYLSSDVVPSRVPTEFAYSCDHETLGDIEQDMLALMGLTEEEISKASTDNAIDEEKELLALIVRNMLNHKKIGQFNHCPKETVLKCVRARRMNVPLAERIVDKSSEAHQDTKTSEFVLLFKEHHDGRQYFLNPQKVESAKTIAIVQSGL